MYYPESNGIIDFIRDSLYHFFRMPGEVKFSAKAR